MGIRNGYTHTCRFIDPYTDRVCGMPTKGTPMCENHRRWVLQQLDHKQTSRSRGRSSGGSELLRPAVQTIELTSKRWKSRMLVVYALYISLILAAVISKDMNVVGWCAFGVLLLTTYRLYVQFMIWWTNR